MENAPILRTIPNNSPVTVTGEQNGFYQIVFQGQTGWGSSNFINITPRQGRVTTAGGNLNLRASPNATSAIITTIPNNSILTVNDISGNFFRINWNGFTGFASRDFIRLI